MAVTNKVVIMRSFNCVMPASYSELLPSNLEGQPCNHGIYTNTLFSVLLCLSNKNDKKTLSAWLYGFTNA